jgi:sulfide:quinone oxidoreductase
MAWCPLRGTLPSMPSALRVLIAGGGVAGVESLLGLHELAGDRVDLTLVTDGTDLHYRPLAVGEPFGGERAHRYPLASITPDVGARLVHGTVAEIDPRAHTVVTLAGDRLDYDVLIVALGAVPHLPYGRALTFDVTTPGVLARLRSQVRRGAIRHLVIALPPGPHWMLPGYELALLLARDEVPTNLAITLTTAEEAPLEVLGPNVSTAVATELDDAGVHTVLDTVIELSAGDPTTVTLIPSGGVLDADLVIALPELHAPTMRGLLTTAHGFLAVDGHGRVPGAPDVYAAGDCTASPLKQGGVAAQQADAVVEHIAAGVGVPIVPRPLPPVLRAQLLTGAGPLWLRRDLGNVHDLGTAARHALWWPPDKIAGRWLAPYLAARDDADAGVPHPPARGRPVEADATSTPVPRDLDLLGDPTDRR